MPNIPRACRAVSDRRQLTHHFFQRLQHLLERGGAVPAYVDRTQRRVGRFDGLYQHIDQIFHVHEIAGLLAITKHVDWHTLLHTLAENTDHPGIRRGRILAWPEYVEEAEDHRLKAML